MIYEINHFRTIPNLLLIFSGIIGVGEPAMLSETTGALHAFRIPLMSVGNRGRQPKIGTYDNILSTAPDIADQAKVIQMLTYILYDNRSIIGLQMLTSTLGEICFEIDLNIFQAIVNIAVEMNVDRIALISADHRATRSFLAEAANVGIRVDDIYEYKSFPTIFSQCKN